MNRPVRNQRYFVWPSTILLATVMCTIGCGPALAADYVVKAKFVLGGNEGWDYLTYDANHNRLFISRGSHVQVVDPRSGRLLADIPDTPGVHGIALAEDLGKGFISNGRGNSVTVFDLGTLRTVTQIKTVGGENPDAIIYEPRSKRVFTFNGLTHNASVIDATGLQLIATIPLDGKPESAAVDGRGMVFVVIEDRNEITQINAVKAAVVQSWQVRDCEEPAALAIDTQARNLFVGCHNSVLAIVNANGGNPVATLPIGKGVDAAVFDPLARLAFSSQGDGTLTVVGQDPSGQYAVLQQVVTQRGARTLALNPESHELYLVTADITEAATEGQTRPRRVITPGTFTLLVVGPGAR